MKKLPGFDNHILVENYKLSDKDSDNNVNSKDVKDSDKQDSKSESSNDTNDGDSKSEQDEKAAVIAGKIKHIEEKLNNL